MRKRALLALALAVGTCGVPAFASPSIAGIGDVRVLSVQFVPSTDGGPGLAAAASTYVVAKVELTNDSPRDYTPDVSRFILTAARNVRYQGIESGATALVGTSNAHRMLKQGDKRLYTVGFRTSDPAITGTISYEP